MPQFDVIRTRGSTAYPFVVDVQADVHTRMATRVVVPMIAHTRYTRPATRLTPIMRVIDDDFVLLVPLMASVPRAALGEVIGTVMKQREVVIAALDLLLTGS